MLIVLSKIRQWNAGTWFIFALTLQDFGASIAFFCSKQYVKAAYWFFAGCICGTTMFM